MVRNFLVSGVAEIVIVFRLSGFIVCDRPCGADRHAVGEEPGLPDSHARIQEDDLFQIRISVIGARVYHLNVLWHGQTSEIAAHEAFFRNDRNALGEFEFAQIGAILETSVSERLHGIRKLYLGYAGRRESGFAYRYDGLGDSANISQVSTVAERAIADVSQPGPGDVNFGQRRAISAQSGRNCRHVFGQGKLIQTGRSQ